MSYDPTKITVEKIKEVLPRFSRQQTNEGRGSIQEES